MDPQIWMSRYQRQFDFPACCDNVGCPNLIDYENADYRDPYCMSLCDECRDERAAHPCWLCGTVYRPDWQTCDFCDHCEKHRKADVAAVLDAYENGKTESDIIREAMRRRKLVVQ